MPAWVERMAQGRWYRLSGDHPDLGLPATPPGTRYLEDNDPAKDAKLNPARSPKEFLRRFLGRRAHSPWHGKMGLASITEAWNGAVFASGFGISGAMIHFGGGHNDYFGSDVHAFDLGTRQWSRISDGYVAGGAGDYGAGAVYPDAVYPDGSPLSPHTYGYVQYDPVGNDYLLFKGQIELGPDVKAVPIAHMFNLDSLKWRRGPRHPAAILASGGCTTWDAARRIIWGHSGDSGNSFIGFTPDGDNGDGSFGSWGTLYPKKIGSGADHCAMWIDPVRDIIVVTVSAQNELYAIDPSAPDREIAALESSGDRPVIAEHAAIEYAHNLDRFVYYSANDGAHIYSIAAPGGSAWPNLTAAAWNWESILDASNGLDPVTDAQAISAHAVHAAHTYGRIRIASYGKIDVAILVRHTDTPVYAMRLN